MFPNHARDEFGTAGIMPLNMKAASRSTGGEPPCASNRDVRHVSIYRHTPCWKTRWAGNIPDNSMKQKMKRRSLRPPASVTS
jgi:hypothetical protein